MRIQLRSKLTTLLTLSAVFCFTTAVANAQVKEKAQPETQEEAAVIAAEIADSEDHKTLAKAIEAAGLKEALEGEGPFTVFAPTEEAFKKVGVKNLEELLEKRESRKIGRHSESSRRSRNVGLGKDQRRLRDSNRRWWLSDDYR